MGFPHQVFWSKYDKLIVTYKIIRIWILFTNQVKFNEVIKLNLFPIMNIPPPPVIAQIQILWQFHVSLHWMKVVSTFECTFISSTDMEYVCRNGIMLLTCCTFEHVCIICCTGRSSCYRWPESWCWWNRIWSELRNVQNKVTGEIWFTFWQQCPSGHSSVIYCLCLSKYSILSVIWTQMIWFGDTCARFLAVKLLQLRSLTC